MAVVVLVHLAVASVIGLLLPYLVDLGQATRTADGITTSETEIAKQFNDDGWLIVATGVAGLVLGVVLQAYRNTQPVVTVLALGLAALAAALVAGWIAQATGPGDPLAALADARRGATASVPFQVDSRAAYLVWPLTALLGALLALLSLPARAGGRETPDHA